MHAMKLLAIMFLSGLGPAFGAKSLFNEHQDLMDAIHQGCATFNGGKLRFHTAAIEASAGVQGCGGTGRQDAVVRRSPPC
jgi:hypothetical protein